MKKSIDSSLAFSLSQISLGLKERKDRGKIIKESQENTSNRGSIEKNNLKNIERKGHKTTGKKMRRESINKKRSIIKGQKKGKIIGTTIENKREKKVLN